MPGIYRCLLVRVSIRLFIVMLAVGIAGAMNGVPLISILGAIAGAIIISAVLITVTFLGDCLLQTPEI